MMHDSNSHSDMPHPEQVYHRQVEREAVVTNWITAIDLEPGDTVMDIGCGPGYISKLVADVVGNEGTVFALDRDGAMLQYFMTEVTDTDIDVVRPIQTDAVALGVRFEEPITVLIALLLHHVNDPPSVLSEVRAVVPSEATVFIVEYHPEAPGTVGPSLAHRIHPETLEYWLTNVGFTVSDQFTFDANEQYAFCVTHNG